MGWMLWNMSTYYGFFILLSAQFLKYFMKYDDWSVGLLQQSMTCITDGKQDLFCSFWDEINQALTLLFFLTQNISTLMLRGTIQRGKRLRAR